jgi:hypothetical protein
MIDTTEAIYDRLKGESTLTGILASNAPFYDKDGSKLTENSIIPAMLARLDTSPPFITIQEGTETRVGEKLTDEVFFIRCYNSREKSFVEIDTILQKIKELLDDYDFTFDNSVNVRCRYEVTLPGLTDEELNLHFREQRYRIFKL